MQKSVHPTSHDQDVQRDFSELKDKDESKLSLFDRDPFAVARLCRALAGAVVVIGLLFLAATTPPDQRAAPYASGATPTVGAEIVTEVQQGDVRSLPDQVVVEQRDERSVPRQF
jgi:hypothetical protein